MTYTAKTVKELRTIAGTGLKKLAAELKLIETELGLISAADGGKGIVTAHLSFETDEQTATRIYFPYKVTINKIRSIVMLAVAATNAGTITGANSTGASADGVVTVAAEAALNVEDSASPSSNNVVLADGYYQLTTAKAAAGGKVLVTLEYTRTA
jgi:hypothetical protein